MRHRQTQLLRVGASALLLASGLAGTCVAQEKEEEGAKAMERYEQQAFGQKAFKRGPAKMTEQEWERSQKIYFNRCAGCHGTLRKGATGPGLEPERMQDFGTESLKYIIDNGTAGGMPSLGKEGILSKEEVDMLARFIQHKPPVPPERALSKIRETWEVTVPPEERPDEVQHDYDVDNLFGVVLRDAGKVAIMDGESKEIVSVVPTGYAVHILRSSASGRYFYSIGRDGKATMIDLWMEKPDKVAEVQPCNDARSIDSSKYEGYEDELAVVGCYWPPHVTVLDGQTLEPLKLLSTRGYTYDEQTYHQEPRVAAIVANHYKPEWVISIKETGYVWLLDYSDLDNITIDQIDAERFLHDGGFDATGRYFQVAANMRDTMVVVDTKEGELEARIPVGTKPHPGRGANWEDPEYGPVTGTTHIGEDVYTVWGSDPDGHPEHAWEVKYELETLGAGSLFTKTHPNSENVWIDHALNKSPETTRKVCAFKKDNLKGSRQCMQLADHGRAVHFEYNKAGDEVWVSIWDSKDKQSEIVIIDDKTMEIKQRITDERLVTPTGKWNVYNTVHDVY